MLYMEVMLIALAVYLIGFAFIAGFFISDEMGIVNPEYVKVTVFAALWPLGIVLVIFQKITGIYIVEKYRQLKKWNKHRKCNHNNIDPCGEYTLENGKQGEKACRDCGKVWWE